MPVYTRHNLEDKIKEILGIDTITPLIDNQITKYRREYNYEYLEIARALYYFYVVQQGDLSKAVGIGIVPYIIQDSNKYFVKLEQRKALQEAEALKLKEADIKVIKCKVEKKRRKKKTNNIESIKEEDDE